MGKQNHWIYRILLMAVLFVSVSLAQHPLKDFRDSVMTAVNSMTDSISRGAAAQQDHAAKTNSFSTNAMIQGGVGDAVSPELLRRKRRYIDFSNGRQLFFQPFKTIAQTHVHRTKRSPCHGGGGGGGTANGGAGDGGDGAEEIETSSTQRRRKAAQQRKRSTTTNNKGQRNSLRGNRKLINEGNQNSRRRRQVENNENKSKISEIVDKIGQRIREGVDSFRNSMKEMAEAFQESYNGGERRK